MENKKYNFIVSNNHILVNIDNGNYYIDTRTPFSFFYGTDAIIINNKKYKSNDQLIKRQDVEKMVGTKVDGLIGLNILSKTGITVNFLDKTITFDVKDGHICYFLKNDEGYYYTSDCVINSNILEKTIIDSGACISYVNEKYLDPSQRTSESYSDYNPMVGDISGDYYEVSIDKVTLGSGSYHHTIKVAKLPKKYEKQGIDIIISLFDIIKDEHHFAPNKTISIDFEKNAVRIS